MIHYFAVRGTGSDNAGLPRVDALARQREIENPQTRDTAHCQCCGVPGDASDLWQVQWAYSYTPNKVIGALAVIAAFSGAALVQYTRTVFHTTHHVICANCATKARRGRIISFGLSYIGLFLSLAGLGLCLALGAWWYLASNAHDRSIAQSWIAFPIVGIAAGIGIVRLATRSSLPRALRPLIKYPFRCTMFTHR